MTNQVNTQKYTEAYDPFLEITKSGYHILKKVYIMPHIFSVWELYTRFKQGEIAVLPEWLQRLQQKKKWTRKKGKRSKQFLYSFFTGNSELTAFYVVNIDILISNIRRKLTENLNVTQKLIYEEMLATLDEKRKQGVVFILLDGQNRLSIALTNFFQGKLTCNQYDEPFTIFERDVNGKLKEDEKGNTLFTELNNFRFTDSNLPEGIKKAFMNTKILLAEGKDGDVEAYIDSIVAMNNGEPWSTFEGAIIKHKPLSYIINKLIFNNSLIQSLFGNDEISGNVYGMTGAYDIEKKGDARFIAEIIHLITNRCNSSFGSENELVTMIDESDENHIKTTEKVKKYLTFISTTMNCPLNKKLKDSEKPLDKEKLRSLILLLDVMFNKQNVAHHHCPFNLNDYNDLKMPKMIFDEFIKWHNKKTDRLATPDDFIGCEPIPGTYAMSTRGLRIKNVEDRLFFINQFLSDNYESWTSLNYIEPNNENYKKYKELLLQSSNYKDIYAKGNHNITLWTKTSMDHTISKKGPGRGTNNINNLVITNPKSNSMKSNKF